MVNPNRQKIFEFIIKHKQDNDGNSPTIRKICNACDISSTSVVDFHLRALIYEGKIIKQNGIISVVGGQWRLRRQPITKMLDEIKLQ
jgi:hypothetical protein